MARKTEQTEHSDVMTDARFLVRLELHVRDSGARRLGYLYPARRFASGEHAEQFGMCLWSTRHRDAVAVHVFPPVDDRALAPDGWSIAEPIHVDCGELSGLVVPAVTVVPAAGNRGRTSTSGSTSGSTSSSTSGRKTNPAPACAPGPDRPVPVVLSVPTFPVAACYSAAATP
jgi:hypothetical protein